MKTVKKITLTAAAIFIMILGFSSCKNREQEPHVPKTAAEARELASRQIWSETPDTVFLGYYWGMSEKEADALTKKYIKEKKFKREMFGNIRYDMTLSNVGDIVTMVKLGFRNDSLDLVSLMVDYVDSPNRVSATELYKGFEDIFNEKGYSYFYEDYNPLLKTSTYDFFKGNTSVTFVETQGFTSMVFCNEYMAAKGRRENSLKEEAIKQKALKEKEEKSNQTRNDF